MIGAVSTGVARTSGTPPEVNCPSVADEVGTFTPWAQTVAAKARQNATNGNVAKKRVGTTR